MEGARKRGGEKKIKGGIREQGEVWQDRERYFYVWERCEWKKSTLLNDKLFLVCTN